MDNKLNIMIKKRQEQFNLDSINKPSSKNSPSSKHVSFSDTNVDFLSKFKKLPNYKTQDMSNEKTHLLLNNIVSKQDLIFEELRKLQLLYSNPPS